MVVTLNRTRSSSKPFPPRKRFTRSEYAFLCESGLLTDSQNYELINGDIVAQMGQKEPHASLVMRWLFALAHAFGESFVRCQMPVDVSEFTELEPDILVTTHPTEVYIRSGETPQAADIRLAVEISVTSLRYDTKIKSTIYAKANIPEYWILNVSGRALIVHRGPMAEGYATVLTVSEDQTISPLSHPDAVFKVSDYLP